MRRDNKNIKKELKGISKQERKENEWKGERKV